MQAFYLKILQTCKTLKNQKHPANSIHNKAKANIFSHLTFAILQYYTCTNLLKQNAKFQS
jgi:hypothetical protein